MHGPAGAGIMRVVEDYPPNYDEIAARFGMRAARAIFSWGDVIYNPAGIFVTPALMAHEEIHGARQAGDVVGWWRRYLDEPEFRLAEEIPAHQAEYRAACLTAHNRNKRRFIQKAIAARLAGPLYGRMIPGHEARRLLRQHTEGERGDGQ